MQFLIAFIIAALSGMGVGGGVLFALYLKLLGGYSQIEIQTVNLIFFLFACSSAIVFHLLKRKIFFIPILITVLAGITGSLLGSALALSLQTDLLGKLFGFMLLGTGFYSLLCRGKK